IVFKLFHDISFLMYLTKTLTAKADRALASPTNEIDECRSFECVDVNFAKAESSPWHSSCVNRQAANVVCWTIQIF
ncbi:hypothetical protein, partial [Geofilum rubicundum]|uniref:hypothetical protein n=1 Tax=Geofilum rubicundum TaxID=472113 RepID=UPI001D0E827C